MTETRRFHLSKWYADCVTTDGDALIVYRATLRWGSVSLSYASLLAAPAGGRVQVRTTLKRAPPVEARGSEVRIAVPGLGVEGSWKARGVAHRERLLAEADGQVDWDCLQPAAAVQVRLGGHLVEGGGYLEHLDLTLPPWRLPIRELRWGRFLGDGSSLVWLEWRGPHPVRVVLSNGGVTREAGVDEDGVRTPELELAFGEKRVLRDGALGATVLSRVPRLRGTLPGGLIGLHETKWCTWATLRREGQAEVQGWAIHEVVKWP